MLSLPDSFAGKAYAALFENAPQDVIPRLIAQERYAQWPSSQMHLPQLTAVLQGMASKSFARSGSPCPAKIIKRFLP